MRLRGCAVDCNKGRVGEDALLRVVGIAKPWRHCAGRDKIECGKEEEAART